MPKRKTHKGIAKRVKVTARGKVKRQMSNRGHLLSGRSPKRRRQLRRGILLSKADTAKARMALGV